ncbi:hypothetical protein PS876_04021 [Pseudomonas fluorescens]|nr:hypothetical protein PS876_04021 [Pseudomonas fluorescens]
MKGYILGIQLMTTLFGLAMSVVHMIDMLSCMGWF